MQASVTEGASWEVKTLKRLSDSCMIADRSWRHVWVFHEDVVYHGDVEEAEIFDMTGDIVLRPIGSNDASFLFELCSDARVNKALAMGFHDVAYWESSIDAWLHDPDEEVYIIETQDQNRRIGWIAFNGMQGTQGIAWIKMMALSPDVWNKGYCRICIDLAKQRLFKMGVQRIRLWVDMENSRALSCYVASGFAILKQELGIVGDAQEQRLRAQMECTIM
jgi:RimJ/RimL family protein N-acetyltransferase